MRHTRQQYLTAYFSFLSVFALALFAPRIQDGSTLQLLSFRQNVGLASVITGMQEADSSSLQSRIANRIRHRLHRNGRATPPLSLIEEAVVQRQEYLRSHVTALIIDPHGKERGEVNISIHERPLWLKPYFSLTKAGYEIDQDAVTRYFEETELPGTYAPEDIALTATGENNGIIRAETTSVAKSGVQVDIVESTNTVIKALTSGEENVDIQLLDVYGSIANETEEDVGELTLIASGRSNFAGSTYARMQNVRKALRAHVNNVVVPPGETFSFNSTLGGPVTQSRGWYIAKVIFGGEELRPAAGGGICQASTTVYRAIVNAGFPVVERRAHSLYVSYYKKHGVGIDATIFPGSQDLTFLNDTEYPLLIQAYDDGYDAVVNIYGTPDGRTVELEGPYFSTNAPEDFLVHGRKLNGNEVAWKQQVSHLDGRMDENVILSRYKTLPTYVKNEYVYAE